MLIDSPDRLLRNLSCRGPVAKERRAAVGHGRRDTAERQYCCQASDRVGAATETKQKDAITGLPHLQDCGITVDDIHSDSEASRLAHEIVEPAISALSKKESGVRLRAETRVIEGQLLSRVDGRLWTAARRSVEFVDIADVLVRREPTGLSRSI